MFGRGQTTLETIKNKRAFIQAKNSIYVIL